MDILAIERIATVGEHCNFNGSRKTNDPNQGLEMNFSKGLSFWENILRKLESWLLHNLIRETESVFVKVDSVVRAYGRVL